MFRHTRATDTTVQIVSYDDFGVIVRQPQYNTTMPLVHGSAWISALYEELHQEGPKLEIQAGIQSVTVHAANVLKVVDATGVTWVVHTRGGPNGPSMASWWSQTDNWNIELKGALPTKMWVRVAACDGGGFPACSSLLAYKDVIVVGGTVDYSASTTDAAWSFTWKCVQTTALTVTPSSSTTLVPLMYAMAHHVQAFTGTSQKVLSNCQARTSHGYMSCSTGRVWRMTVRLPSFDFDFSAGFVDCGHKLTTKIAFLNDWDYDPGPHGASGEHYSLCLDCAVVVGV